jgi:hypothetical protein
LESRIEDRNQKMKDRDWNQGLRIGIRIKIENKD